MYTTTMPSGEIIHYSYDGSRDELVIQLREAPSTLSSSPHPLSDRAFVERDPASGETVAVRVRVVPQPAQQRAANRSSRQTLIDPPLESS